MTLKAKLIAAQMPLIAALAILSAISLTALDRLGTRSQDILKDNYRSVLAAERMKEAVERIEDAAALSLLAGGTGGLEARLSPHLTTFEEELRVEEGNITEDGELPAAQRLRQRWETARRLLGGFRD
ncbi:MAG: PAS domain-containing sensor histidine kinase, partial [Deltaproteobacteria bacterium]|nr:PAS domain-containing sensor histidine kinase [Deltaproteobacteria bacterium]